MSLTPEYSFFPGGLPYIRDSRNRMHLVYDMLERRDGLFVLNFPSLLTIDFDTPSDRHVADDAVVGHTLTELVSLLQGSDAVFTKHGYPPSATWRIHKTAGGFHAFRMDVAIPPTKQAAALLADLPCDPGYVSLVRNTQTWPIRVSRKRKDEVHIYSVVEEKLGGDICEECRLQVWLYEQMVKKYGN